MARSTARKRALNTLYEADEKGQDILSLLAERIANPGAQTPLPDYAIDIVRGVAEHRGEIDHLLDEHSTGWKVKRMAVVDRNVLRIATWEILYNDDVPDKVAIDEAITLTKTLSDEHSTSFIHGLLSAICAVKDEHLAHQAELARQREDEQVQASMDEDAQPPVQSGETDGASGGDTADVPDVPAAPDQPDGPDTQQDSPQDQHTTN
ncbi:transcription antitermination factor NusB [Bifidobacterium thermophilum]|uniref:transcription antitermination factor NusB n=1 Tax=Bifidobacterium thermophilum TaxID=33905 RepID=UPI0030A9185A